MKDLVILDPETANRENCGAIIQKRTIGTVLVWLTYDATAHMWWIVWQSDRLRKLGFIEARREDCWETFFQLTEADLAKPRPS